MFKLTLKDVSRAMAFTARTFVAQEPTSVALKFTTCDFVTSFADVMTKSIKSGLSFAVEDENGDIVAQSLSIDYDTFVMAKYGHTRESAPMFDLFSKLDAYVPNKECVVVFAISSEVQGKGLASALLTSTIEEANRSGYSMVLADCTNFKSQNLFSKFGFSTKVTINYKNYEYGVTKPYACINDTQGIQRMVLHI
jgi:GNAT superfamily N-acetyltransferase